MLRRDMLKLAATAGALTVTGARAALAQTAVDRATRAMPSPIIKDIQVIATQPGGQRLVVVKVITDQAGLYGYGCATIAQRADVVIPAVEKYLRPLLLGKPADRIEDTWQMMVNGAQWRFGPILNNAMSGVDEALWDIKGRQAGMPVYQLLGGKCREAVEAYAGALDSDDVNRAVDHARQFMAQGYRNFKCFPRQGGPAPKGLMEGPAFNIGSSLRHGVRVLEELRKQLGPDVGLLYDIHRVASPNEAIQFCKDVEHLKMFYVEDPFSNQDFAWHRLLRQQCTTPISAGELFTNPNEWVPLVSERLIDFIRTHVSALGGVTPCRKQAAMAELLGVKTSWHGSGDITPVGHMANVHMDLAFYNTGIQEFRAYDDLTKEMFPGCPEMRNGYVYANDKPGWGIEVNEALAARYPYKASADGMNGGYPIRRIQDGSVYHP